MSYPLQAMMTQTDPESATGCPVTEIQYLPDWKAEPGAQGLCTMRGPDGTHHLIYDAGEPVAAHLHTMLPDGTPVVAGIYDSEITPVICRIHQALSDDRDPDPADLWAAAAWENWHGPHYCPEGCE